MSGFIRWLAYRATAKALNPTAGHDVGILPGGYVLHHGTCSCGWGMHSLWSNRDRRELRRYLMKAPR